MYIIAYTPINSQLLIVVLLNNITIIAMLVIQMTGYVCVLWWIWWKAPFQLPQHRYLRPLTCAACNILMTSLTNICANQYQMVCVAVIVKTNDVWTATFMLYRFFSTMMVHHIRCIVQAPPPIKIQHIHARP